MEECGGALVVAAVQFGEHDEAQPLHLGLEVRFDGGALSGVMVEDHVAEAAGEQRRDEQEGQPGVAGTGSQPGHAGLADASPMSGVSAR